MCEEVKGEGRRGECGKGKLLLPDTMNWYKLLDSLFNFSLESF
jgi:hypothetical protein